jgi:ferrous iron transport protein B
MDELLQAIDDVASGRTVNKPHRIKNQPQALKRPVKQLTSQIQAVYPDLPNANWLALRLLDGDARIIEAVENDELGDLAWDAESRIDVGDEEQPNGKPAILPESQRANPILAQARSLRWEVGHDFHERLVEAIYTDAARLADRAVTPAGEKPRFDFDRTLDRIVTSRRWGIPIMLLVLSVVFWLTITGANAPSALLASLLLDTVHPALKAGAAAINLPWWLDGLLIDGMYLATAWVVSVMLPPMAIFFPLFTLAEDFGYLPRVVYNLDTAFKKVGAHGKQALSMSMGFGCNAAGVVATRVIDSPRERLIAIITNNFALCNGRWPTQILIATIFIGTLVPAHFAGLISALAVVGIAVLGVLFSFVVSWFLSRTWLKGEVSTFSLELPPYRPPRILQTIYTSVIDRTLIVLWRAVVFALPAGAVIWLSANVMIGGVSIAEHLVSFLNPFGLLLGLNGVILVAYIVAIPANEIVIPTVLMLTVLVAGVEGGAGTGVMFELEGADTLTVLQAGGWTLLTGVNLMLFSLLHNPCSTTLYTIYQETKSWKWTTISALLPLAMGFTLTFVVAQVARLFGAA